MKLFKISVAWLLMFGMSSSTFAGGLGEAIGKAIQQQTQSQPAKIDKGYVWAGGALFVAGMSMALYGFLHTSGGEFVSGEVSKESKAGLGGTGLAIAGAGGAILYLGSQRAKTAPSITLRPGRVTLTKQIAW